MNLSIKNLKNRDCFINCKNKSEADKIFDLLEYPITHKDFPNQIICKEDGTFIGDVLISCTFACLRTDKIKTEKDGFNVYEASDVIKANTPGVKKTIAQELNITEFPFYITDNDNQVIYCEFGDNSWHRNEFDDKSNLIYHENSNGGWMKNVYNFNNNTKEVFRSDSCGRKSKEIYDQINNNRIYLETKCGYWEKYEYDAKNRRIYFLDSAGYWWKREYDDNDNVIYYQNSKGAVIDQRPLVLELTLDKIAEKFGVNVKNIKIVK